jgi:hypothetical protein
MSYFAIERNNQCWDRVGMRADDGSEIEMWDRYRGMTYNEMKSREDLSDFVADVMCAANDISGTNGGQTIITLIGDDNVFIWSILMDYCEEDFIRYCLIDWKKDEKKYRYTP